MTNKPSQAQIRQTLINHMAELLQVPGDQLDPTASFLEQGADSIVLIEAVRRIENSYGVRISMQQFFEQLPSIETLSTHLAEHAVTPEPSTELKAIAGVGEQAKTQPPVPPSTSPVAQVSSATKDRHQTIAASNETMGLMQAQIQLVKHTIEQQNRVLASQSLSSISKMSSADETPSPKSEIIDKPAAVVSNAAVSQFSPRQSALLAATQIDSINSHSTASIDFGLYFFGTYEAPYTQDKYELLLNAVKYGDENNFSSAWLPERHFHSFGGLSPNPAVLCAALAATTSNIGLRAGSVVAPLHHPVRLTEEWSVVDSISRGRVGIAFACGWHSNDFIFAPEHYDKRQAVMDNTLDQVRSLWRGEQISFPAGNSTEHTPTLFPRPCQPELPVWLTIVNNLETYQRAGRDGYAVLTNLMGQSPEVFEKNLAAYRAAWRVAGHPGRGHVSLLMHTFVMDDAATAIETARIPFTNYLKSAVGLFKTLVGGLGKEVDFDHLSEADRDYLLNVAYQNYIESRALIGSPTSTSTVVDKLVKLGVDEIGCFVDFGVDAKIVEQNLPALNQLRQRYALANKARALG